MLAAAPPPLPTFVPQGMPPPTASGTVGGTSTGGGGGPVETAGMDGFRATGGGILPGFALAVRLIYNKTKIVVV